VLNPAELRIDTFRAWAPAASTSTRPSPRIRVTHLPTGIVVECQARARSTRSEKALGVLAARIRDKQLREQQAQDCLDAQAPIGSGDRSERIRTYNFRRAASPTTASTSRSTRSPHHGRRARRADRARSRRAAGEQLAQLTRNA